MDNAELQELGLPNEFKNAKCVTLCELSIALADQEKMSPPKTPEAKALFMTCHDYARRFSKITSREAILQLRSYLEREQDLFETEIATLVDLFPQSVEAATGLLPTLSRLPTTRIATIIQQLEQTRARSM